MLRFYEECMGRMKHMYEQMEELIAGLSMEDLDWVPGEDMNSLAVNVVHIIGVNAYLMSDIAANIPHGRDHDEEMSASGFTEAQLKQQMDGNLTHMRQLLEPLTLEDVDLERASPTSGRLFTVAWGIYHALDHTGMHLGHMQITRQLLDRR